ncbi:MAG: tetratricopeptide repeat protein [Planctomycetes bacterium]|nr:tetratricopeptide repeat protein [Planctomycetota bacterium]
MADEPKQPERPETLLNIPSAGEESPVGAFEKLSIPDAQSGETLLELDSASESVLSRVDRSTGAALSGNPVELKTDDMHSAGTRDSTKQSASASSSRGFTDRLKGGGTVKYEPERELGRGGMGVVLSVRDNDLRREVAMKVVRSDRAKRGSAAGDVALRRFIEEAQITGQLEHPNIVPVHELGADAQGRIYFTMKLVRGKPLSVIIRELRRGDATTEAEYSLDRLLQIFMKVCDALSFAHAHNVVHRDLKPENIMIGRFGEVMVMDWGLARLLDQPEHGFDNAVNSIETDSHMRKVEDSAAGASSVPSALSMEGTVAGTPAYMAPEQALGEISRIDQQTDVFALGAILYEILVLRPPYTAKGGTNVIEQAARGELTDPFERVAGDEQLRERLVRLPGGKIPPELAAVAMHALAKRKEDRYATVRSMKDDVENYIAGRPVSVHSDFITVRMAKWVRRHPTLSMSSGAAALVLLLATASIMFIVAQARQEAIKQQEQLVATSQQAEQEAEKRAKAESDLKQAAIAREAALEKRAEAVALYREGTEQAQRARQMSDSDVRKEARKAAESALKQATVADETYVDPVFALAQLLHFFGDRQALDYYSRTNQLMTADGGRGDARALVYAGNFARDVLGELTLAEQYFRQAAELDPNDPHAIIGQGMLAISRGEFERAVELAIQARERDETLWESWYLQGYALGSELTPDDRTLNPIYDPERAEELFTEGVARSNRQSEIYAERGLVRINLERFGDAEDDLRRAIELAPGNTTSRINLSIVLRYLKRSEEALQITEQAVKDVPGSYHAWSNYGMALFHVGRDDEAAAAIAKSLTLQPGRPIAHQNLARIYTKMGKYEEARTQAKKALEAEPKYFMAWVSIAHIDETEERYEQALADIEQAITLQPEDAIVLATKARILLRVERFTEARSIAGKALELKPDSALALRMLGLCELQQGNHQQSVELLEESIKHDPDSWESYLNLATAYQLLGRYDKARQAAERVIELQPEEPLGHYRLGTALLLMDRPEDGISYLRRATELDPKYVDSWVNRASAANSLSLLEEARDASHKVTEIAPSNVLGWVNLGRAELALGNTESAGLAADKAASLEAKNARERSVAADLLHEIGRYAEAYNVAQSAIVMDEGDPEGWRAAARALFGLRRLPEALEAAEKQVALQPGNTMALNFVATLQVELKRFAEAEATAKKTLEVDPLNALALTTLGNARSYQGQYRLSVEAYEAALRVEPGNANTWLNLGVSWLLLNDFDRCVPAFKEATDIQPDLAPAWEYWGTALVAQQRYKDAIEKLLKALELNPNSSGAHANLANAYYFEGDKAKAAEHAGRTVELNPANANAWYRLGISHFDLGQWKEAAPAFEQVAALAPDNQYILYLVAHCRAELGEYETSKAWAEKALALDARLSSARVILARAELGLGHEAEALKQLKQGLIDGADPTWALNQSWWDDIRESEGFQALVKEYGG